MCGRSGIEKGDKMKKKRWQSPKCGIKLLRSAGFSVRIFIALGKCLGLVRQCVGAQCACMALA